MKKHLSKITIGVLGICIGFALCYFAGFSPGTLKTGNNVVVVKNVTMVTNNGYTFMRLK